MTTALVTSGQGAAAAGRQGGGGLATDGRRRAAAGGDVREVAVDHRRLDRAQLRLPDADAGRARRGDGRLVQAGQGARQLHRRVQEDAYRHGRQQRLRPVRVLVQQRGEVLVLLQRDAQPVEVPRGEEGHRHQVRRADRATSGWRRSATPSPVLPEQDGRAGQGRGAARPPRTRKRSRTPNIQLRRQVHVQARDAEIHVGAEGRDVHAELPAGGALAVPGRGQPRELVQRREGQPEVRRGREPERSVLPAPRHPLHPRSRRQGDVRRGGQLRDRERAQDAVERHAVRGPRHDRREVREGEGHRGERHLRARGGPERRDRTSTRRSGASRAAPSSRRSRGGRKAAGKA